MVDSVIIIGSNGRIGSALCSYASANKIHAHPVSRSDYTSWENKDDAITYLSQLETGENTALLYAAGIINPATSVEEIHKSNVILPAITCQAARHLNMKAITLGTVLEKIVPPNAQNPYVKSKYELQQIARDNWIHLQLHTIFGGVAPTQFMFTGQILNALNTNQRFSMTDGLQHREYHHVDDEVAAIFGLIHEMDKGCFDISHGNTVKLKDMAQAIFGHFGKQELLGIGDLKSPQAEAYKPVFTSNPILSNYEFRNTLPAIIKWLEHYIQ